MSCRDQQDKQARGVGLLILVIGVAIAMALGVLGVLILTTGHATLSKAQINQIKARYAAEAGVAWALDRLWPPGSSYSGETLPWDVDGNGVIAPNEKIVITVDSSGVIPRKITVKVTY